MSLISAVRVVQGLKRKRQSWSSYWTPTKEIDGETPDLWIKSGSRSGNNLVDSVNAGTGDIKILTPVYLPSSQAKAYTGFITFLPYPLFEFNIGDSMEFKFIYKAQTGLLFALPDTGTDTAYAYITAGATASFNFTIKETGQSNLLINSPNGTLVDGTYYSAKVTWTSQTRLDLVLNGTAYNNSVAGTRTKRTASVGFAGTTIGTVIGLNHLVEIWKNDTLHYIFNGEKGVFSLQGGQGKYGDITFADNKRYSLYGSRYMLDNGYAVYMEQPAAGGKNIYYPLDGGKNNFLALGSTSVANYYFSKTQSGSLVDHNGYDSLLQMVGDVWDRSDETIWSAAARGGYYDPTSEATKKLWHISELTNENISAWANEGYEGRCFVKVLNGVLKDIFTYATNKEGIYYTAIMNYCGNENLDFEGFGAYTIDYSYDDHNVVATRGNKELYFDGINTLYLSLDGGANFPISKNVGLSIITHAHIFLNGNILFCDHTKAYLSTDNLSNFAETTVLGIDGNAFVAGTLNNFRCLQYDHVVLPSGTEMLIWGSYPTSGTAERTNINIWYSIDNGVTIKSCFKANTTTPVFDIRHCHCVNYNPVANEFLAAFGDGGLYDGAKNIKGVYDENLDTWSWTDTGHNLMITGYAFKGDWVYYGVDSGGSAGGVYFCKYSDYGTVEGIDQGFALQKSGNNKAVIGVSGNVDDQIIVVGQTDKWIISTADGISFKIETMTGGDTLNATFPYLLKVLPKNTAGEFIVHQVVVGETIDNWTLGQVVRIKLVKTV